MTPVTEHHTKHRAWNPAAHFSAQCNRLNKLPTFVHFSESEVWNVSFFGDFVCPTRKRGGEFCHNQACSDELVAPRTRQIEHP